MKTAVWLYLFLFVAFFDLHAQYPILTPFAISLGAAPSFIGLMMGLYSITHLPGNLIAGYGVDRFGSRLFIVGSLLFAGIILLLQSGVTNPWQLLVLRSVSGFVLAFLSPACMALLVRIARNQVQQGKLMAGNGLVHTLASVVSPAAGAMLVAKIGFAQAFVVLGWVLIATALCALLFVRDEEKRPQARDTRATRELARTSGPARPPRNDRRQPVPAAGAARTDGFTGLARTSGALPEREEPAPWPVFLLPVAISCSQGILFFELPLLARTAEAIMTTGLMFSVVSIGALITLSMLFLNRYSPFWRTMGGALALALSFFAMAVEAPVSLYVPLLFVGLAKGVIFPAMSALLIQLSGRARYGRTFSLLSIASSVGAFLGPLLAGHLRDEVSSYYIAFLVLMAVVAVLPGRICPVLRLKRSAVQDTM